MKKKSDDINHHHYYQESSSDQDAEDQGHMQDDRDDQAHDNLRRHSQDRTNEIGLSFSHVQRADTSIIQTRPSVIKRVMGQ